MRALALGAFTLRGQEMKRLRKRMEGGAGQGREGEKTGKLREE